MAVASFSLHSPEAWSVNMSKNALRLEHQLTSFQLPVQLERHRVALDASLGQRLVLQQEQSRRTFRQLYCWMMRMMTMMMKTATMTKPMLLLQH